MLKSLMISTAVAAMMLGSAAAQQPKAPAPETKTPPGATTTTSKFITNQTADQWLASKFRGTDVIGNDNKKIGDVSDILFDHNGRVMAYVIGVGGFLGIGSKDVAITPASFQLQQDKNEMKLKLAMTKNDLKNAPAFKAYTAPRAPTTGQGNRMPPAKH